MVTGDGLKCVHCVFDKNPTTKKPLKSSKRVNYNKYHVVGGICFKSITTAINCIRLLAHKHTYINTTTYILSKNIPSFCCSHIKTNLYIGKYFYLV